MTTIDRARLTLPDGTTFEGAGSLTVNMQQQRIWLFNGANNLAAFFERWWESTGGTASRADSPMQTAYLGSGAGTRRHVIGFDKWQGESGQSWAGVADSASIQTKLDTLEYELATQTIDSASPMTLEHGEFHDGANAKYNPIPVVPGDVDLTVEYADDAVVGRGRVECIEAADLDQVID